MNKIHAECKLSLVYNCLVQWNRTHLLQQFFKAYVCSLYFGVLKKKLSLEVERSSSLKKQFTAFSIGRNIWFYSSVHVHILSFKIEKLKVNILSYVSAYIKLCTF